MKIRDKLELMKEMDEREKARINAFLNAVGAHKALEIHATAVMGSLDILAQHYNVPRAELLEQLIIMLQAAESNDKARFDTEV